MSGFVTGKYGSSRVLEPAAGRAVAVATAAQLGPALVRLLRHGAARRQAREPDHAGGDHAELQDVPTGRAERHLSARETGVRQAIISHDANPFGTLRT